MFVNWNEDGWQISKYWNKGLMISIWIDILVIIADITQLILFVLQGKATWITQLYDPPYKLITSGNILHFLVIEIIIGIGVIAYLGNILIRKKSNDLEALFIFLSNFGLLFVLLPMILAGDARIGPPSALFTVH